MTTPHEPTCAAGRPSGRGRTFRRPADLAAAAALVALALGPSTVGAEVARAAPEVAIVEVRTSGPIDEQAARERLDKSLRPLERCYGRLLAKDAELGGVVRLRVLVGDKGGVVAATLEQTGTAGGELEKCASRHAMDLRFPAGKGHATVRYAVSFGGSVTGVIGLLQARTDLSSAFGSLDGSGLQGVGGMVGTGGGGGGIGEGTIGLGSLGTPSSTGPRPAKRPAVRPGAATVTGSLDRTIVQRIVRRHLNQVRFCYERELAGQPSLAGQVTVEFTISPAGSVSEARVGASTLGSAAVEGCVLTAVRRWSFPAPEGGGVVRVRYPFVFQSGPAAAP